MGSVWNNLTHSFYGNLNFDKEADVAIVGKNITQIISGKFTVQLGNFPFFFF